MRELFSEQALRLDPQEVSKAELAVLYHKGSFRNIDIHVQIFFAYFGQTLLAWQTCVVLLPRMRYPVVPRSSVIFFLIE